MTCLINNSPVKRILVYTLLILVTFTISCKKENIIEPTKPNTSADAVLDLGGSVNAKFFGVVQDEAGSPVSGALITAGNKTATTDANGVFIIENASVFEELAYVSASKLGYFLGSRSVIPSTTATNNIRITLLDMNTVGTVNSGVEETVSLPSGAKIDFKGKYVDLNGSVYSGAVNVASKHLPALAPETANQMPGMLYAQNQNEEAGVLETFGMIAVELTGSSGEELQIDPSSAATIHMPVDASQLASAPTSIPLWHFDEIAGYWIEDGSANLESGMYVGEVNHFSFWNCDLFAYSARLVGTVTDQNGIPLDNITVLVSTPNSSTSGQTSYNGFFETFLPNNTIITVEIIDDCGNSIFTTTVGPYAPLSYNPESLIVTLNASNSVEVTGVFYDCNNNLVTNGYVNVTAGSKNYYQVITNGAIDVPILFCNIPPNLSITAYDYDNGQETSTINTPVLFPITNLGSLIACNSISEYITYSIDGGTPTNLYTPINCGDDMGTGIQVQHLPDQFQLNIRPSATGTYPYAPFIQGIDGTVKSSSINIDETQPVNISFQFLYFGVVGDYIDVSFNGTYTDINTGNIKSISGFAHAIRDI